MFGYGRHVFGAAAIALGLVGLIFGDFAAVWQPVPKELPHYGEFAYAAAIAEILGGLTLQWRRTAWAGALVLALLYAVFAFYWARRIIGFPEIFGTWSGFAEELALVAASIMAIATASLRRTALALPVARIARLVFGLCVIAFGVAHFLYVKETAAMVPAWMPPGQDEWALVTGVLHIMAGLALVSNIAALVAAQLLTAMFAAFGLLVWAPQILANPGAHMAWAGNAINLALVGAAWVVADGIANLTGSGASSPGG